MDTKKTDRVRELCSRIQTERDQQTFLHLVQELNQVLDEEGNSSRLNSSRFPDRNQPPGA